MTAVAGRPDLHAVPGSGLLEPSAEQLAALAEAEEERDAARLARIDDRMPLDILDPKDTAGMHNIVVGAIASGGLRNVYHRAGVLAEVLELPENRVAADDLIVDRLAHLIASRWYCFALSVDRDGREEEKPVMPSGALLKWVLACRDWPDLPQLRGVISAPILRADGSILQQDGFDRLSGYYLKSAVSMDPVPDEPTAEDVTAARSLIVDEVLIDFPFEAQADGANAVAAILAPALRFYLGELSPMFVITAPEQDTGKGLLAEVVGAAYGSTMGVVPRTEDEMRKKLGALLHRSQEPVIIFDNVAHLLASESLAMILTQRHTRDRILQATQMIDMINDRTWVATGNNIKMDADMAVRNIVSRLNWRAPDPGKRAVFTINKKYGVDLHTWLAGHRGDLLHAQLVLLKAWLVAGAPRAERFNMKVFTPWCRAMGGLLDHHGITEFLGNRDEIREVSQELAEREQLYLAWRRIFGARFVDAGHVYQRVSSAETGITPAQVETMAPVRALRDALPVGGNGQTLPARHLGRKLNAMRGQWADRHVMCSRAAGKHATTYAVLTQAESELETAAGERH